MVYLIVISTQSLGGAESQRMSKSAIFRVFVILYYLRLITRSTASIMLIVSRPYFVIS